MPRALLTTVEAGRRSYPQGLTATLTLRPGDMRLSHRDTQQVSPMSPLSLTFGGQPISPFGHQVSPLDANALILKNDALPCLFVSTLFLFYLKTYKPSSGKGGGELR
jgi:hypothetical protein